jgi:hypothetical protein
VACVSQRRGRTGKGNEDEEGAVRIVGVGGGGRGRDEGGGEGRGGRGEERRSLRWGGGVDGLRMERGRERGVEVR